MCIMCDLLSLFVISLRDLNMASATSLAASNSKRQRRAMPAASGQGAR